MPRPLLAALALLLGVRPCGAQSPPTPAAPTLVVLVTVDQMRADYLERFAPQLQGGLARLAHGGAWFTDAHQDHGITETAPGHASLLSGRFPRSTGIWANRAGVDDPGAPVLGAPGGASPRRFEGTTLVDWLHARDGRSRALAVSAKDRSAILPVGRARQQVYWYVPDGRFTTSRWYADTLPAWVRRFNDRHAARRLAGHAWRLMRPDSEYPERDDVDLEGAGHDFVFPHQLPADSAAAADFVRVTPWIDEIELSFALDGVSELALGAGPATDVLSVSLSGTDFIGHRYGPDSREMHDQLLRLDRSLGSFLDSLFRLRDSMRVAVVLTADHGMSSIPELVSSGVRPHPMRVDVGEMLGRMRAMLRAAGAGEDEVLVDPPIVLADRARLARRRVNADSLIAALAVAARATPGVLRADRWADLQREGAQREGAQREGAQRDPIARRWVHQFPITAPIELVLTLTPGSVWGEEGPVATHGSPWDDDTHVPLIFYGPAFRAGRYAGFVRSVDVAPTLAVITGVTPAEPLDGVALRQAIAPARR